MKSARRRAREYALQGLYQWLISHEEPSVIEAQLRDNTGFAQIDQAHFSALLYGTIREAEHLRDSFKLYLDRSLQELSPIEHAVLLMGSYELAQFPDIPYRVIINEAVELTKSFGGTDGFKYVNGILDKQAMHYRHAEVSPKCSVKNTHE